MHDVLRVLAERAQAGSRPGERDDGFRVALAIEGGGMRGTISAGMALALDELGLVPIPTPLRRLGRGHHRRLAAQPAGAPAVSRLATDGRLLRAAFESGRAATHAAFTSLAPSVPPVTSSEARLAGLCATSHVLT